MAKRIGPALPDLRFDVRDVPGHVVLDEVESLRDHFVGVTRAAGDIGDGEGGALPHVLVIDLGHGYLEAPAELGLEALEHGALALEGAHVRQVQLDGADRHPCDRHARASSPACYSDRATSSVVKASMMSPGCTPLIPSTPMPHSRPCSTSRTSSLKRLRELRTFSPSRVSPRLMRARAVRTIFLSTTMQPKIVPTLEIGKSCLTWARPCTVSRISGARRPESAALTSFRTS